MGDRDEERKEAAEKREKKPLSRGKEKKKEQDAKIAEQLREPGIEKEVGKKNVQLKKNLDGTKKRMEVGEEEVKKKVEAFEEAMKKCRGGGGEEEREMCPRTPSACMPIKEGR